MQTIGPFVLLAWAHCILKMYLFDSYFLNLSLNIIVFGLLFTNQDKRNGLVNSIQIDLLMEIKANAIYQCNDFLGKPNNAPICNGILSIEFY